MAFDIPRAIEMMVDALHRQQDDEVDLVFRYGSTLRGNTHLYSDLDISWVPAHDDTWYAITVLVDDTMIDLYPIHWPRLEQMAEFDVPSCPVLLESEIVYHRSEVAAERFRALAARLRAQQQPQARRDMLRKALEVFQRTGYPYYLLRQAAADGHASSCLREARNILQTVLHCLMVANQAAIDTRKLDQVLELPKLPAGFARTVHLVTGTSEPKELLAACETLLRSTHDLLLAEQRQALRSAASFPQVFQSAYPELKADLQHLMLACERRDLLGSTLMSLYHELMIHMAQAITGIEYSGFNSLAEYEQDLVALGFPDLLSYLQARDFDGLHSQCHAFDRRLREYLTEHSVPLHDFASLDELQEFLDTGPRPSAS